jgi:hypothetical protein
MSPGQLACAPWLNVVAISAAQASDVLRRNPFVNCTSAQRAAAGRKARAKSNWNRYPAEPYSNAIASSPIERDSRKTGRDEAFPWLQSSRRVV